MAHLRIGVCRRFRPKCVLGYWALSFPARELGHADRYRLKHMLGKRDRFLLEREVGHSDRALLKRRTSINVKVRQRGSHKRLSLEWLVLCVSQNQIERVARGTFEVLRVTDPILTEEYAADGEANERRRNVWVIAQERRHGVVQMFL